MTDLVRQLIEAASLLTLLRAGIVVPTHAILQPVRLFEDHNDQKTQHSAEPLALSRIVCQEITGD